MKKIRTSQRHWFKSLAIAYRDRAAISVVDDAGIGLKPQDESLLQIGQRADLTAADWAAAAMALSVSAAGVWMIRLAFVDPEPTSKLGMLLAGGAACVLFGGSSAIWILTQRRPPNVELGPGGIKLGWA